MGTEETNVWWREEPMCQEESGYQSCHTSSSRYDVLPVCDVAAAFNTTGHGLLPGAAGFFRTTRAPSAALPPSVPTLLSEPSTLAFFTPLSEVPCGNTRHEKIYSFPYSWYTISKKNPQKTPSKPLFLSCFVEETRWHFKVIKMFMKSVYYSFFQWQP